MPRSSDMDGFRPPTSHAKAPRPGALAKALDAAIPMPRPPVSLDKNPTARRHFMGLASTFTPRVAHNPFVLMNLEQCALLWSRQVALLASLPSRNAATDKARLSEAKTLMVIYSQRLLECRRAARLDAVRLPPAEAPPKPPMAVVRDISGLLARRPPDTLDQP